MATITIVDGSATPTTTYSDGPGNPNQGSFIWDVATACMWFFQIQSSKDSTGNPGTHKVSAWRNPFSSCGGDPAAGAYAYYGDSPNLDSNGDRGSPGNGGLLFRNGRSMGMYYRSNLNGQNKGIAHLVAALYMASGVPADANSIVGNARIIFNTDGSLTWGTWGRYVCNNFNYANATTIAAMVIAQASDGYMHIGSAMLTDQLDLAMMSSRDPDRVDGGQTGGGSDTWTTGGVGTGTYTAGSAVITALSNQTGLAVGYSFMGNMSESGGKSTNKINSIDSDTQVTLDVTAGGAGTNTGVNFGWSNFTPAYRATGVNADTRGSIAGNIIVDSTMVNECNGIGLVPLPNGQMLAVYDNGAVAAPSMQQLSSIKSNSIGVTAGFWPNDGSSGDTTVFTTNLTGTSQTTNTDFCVCSIRPPAANWIYCAGRRNETIVDVRSYNPVSNLWQSLTNLPPTMTSKTIKAGGGVCLVSDGTLLYCLVIDTTDGQVKYSIGTPGGNETAWTWGAWTNLAATGTSPGFLTATIVNGYLAAVWAEKNGDGTHYDTKIASLSVGSHFALPVPRCAVGRGSRTMRAA